MKRHKPFFLLFCQTWELSLFCKCFLVYANHVFRTFEKCKLILKAYLKPSHIEIKVNSTFLTKKPKITMTKRAYNRI